MTKQELELTIKHTGNPRWRDAVDPERVDNPLSLAINRCLVREFAARPPVVGEYTPLEFTRAEVENELLVLGYDPAYHERGLDDWFPPERKDGK